MKIPIVRLKMEVAEEVEYLREPLTSSREAAEWIERTVVRHSNREHIIVVCCDGDRIIPILCETELGFNYGYGRDKPENIKG